MAGEGKNSLSSIVPRGFLKAYLLVLLRKKPVHGYALIKGVHEKTGFWKPSPGAIYPLLNSLVREGYIEASPDSNRRKVYKLTKKGIRLSREFEKSKHHLNEHISKILCQMTPASRKELMDFFKSASDDYLKGPLVCSMHQTYSFLIQVSKHPEKAQEASKIMNDTNRRLMKLLKEGGR